MGSSANLNSIFFIPVIFTTLLLFQVEGSLTLTNECGELTCREYDYCDAIDHTCRPCDRICNPKTNNFDENSCETKCQVYLHDQRFIKNGNSSMTELQSSQMYRDLQKDIQILKILVGLSVGLTAICLIAVIIVFIVFIKIFGRGKSSEKSKPLELHANYNNTNKYNGSSDVSSTTQPSLKSPSVIGLGNNNSVAPMPMKYENAPPSITHRYQREPSESTLPEYAYDNASLSPTSHHV